MTGTRTYEDSRPDDIDVTIGTIDAPDAFAPVKEIWVEQKLSWESLNDEIPQFPRSSVGS